ncbi:hypothetical protein [Streptococcus sanguinis]|uniref:Uncharacterized protein n=1 Tax=Streptococcus sanguinis SK355 TaxID=888816 RepID=F3UMJ2_STRSA|nr:hypothetical protein [Streptococcus sanguinis]EGJ44147.1 hypothetical protein HMPREF9389_0050 [Streptococcus sanguinis SK355]
MRKLRRKDRIISGGILVVSLFVSYLLKGYVLLNHSDTVSFISVIMGFLLSAIAILYSSPIRSVLYDKKSNIYSSKWEEIIVRYFYTFVVSLLYMMELSLGINCIPNFINVGFLLSIVIIIIVVTKGLFKLLLVEIND